MTLHPIGFACRRTGLSPDVIRVWERRYGAVQPVRAEGGRRLYSDADVERLRLLAAAARAGHAIGLLAALPDAELRRLAVVEAPPGAASAAPEAGTAAGRRRAFVQECLAAAAACDDRRLRAALERASLAHGRLELVEALLAPMLERVGEAWKAGELTPAHEHLVSAVVRDFLASSRGTGFAAGTAPRLLVTTLSGERHELGAWLVTGAAGAAGWEATWLGADLPPADVAAVARTLGAAAVALSVTVTGDRAAADVAALRAALPDVPLLVGGRGAAGLAEAAGGGVTVLASLRELPAALAALAGGAGPAKRRPGRSPASRGGSR